MDVPIRVAAKSQGVHSAALEIVDRKLDMPVQWAMTVIVAAQPLTAANGYTVQRQVAVSWPNATMEFIRVPEGTQALAITATVTKGRVALKLHDPTKEAESSRSRETEEQLNEGKQGTRVVSTPLPGVWGLIFYQCTSPGACAIYSDSTKYQVNAELTYTVRALRADGSAVAEGDGSSDGQVSLQGRLARSPVVTPPADSAVPFTTSVSFASRFAPIPKAEVRSELGLYLERTGRVFADSAPKPLDVTIDSGTTSLRVRVTSDVPAGAELYLYDCTGRTCDLWDARRRDARVQEIVLPTPATGRWRIAIDGAEAPAGGAAYTLEVVRTGARYGTATPATPERVGDGSTQRTWVMAWRRGTIKDTAWAPVLVSDLVDPATFAESLAKPLAKQPKPPTAPPPLSTVVTPLALPGRSR